MKNNAGVFPGIFSCIFGVIGILSLGFIFVPLAAIMAIISTILAVANLSFRGIGVSILAWTLTIIGLITSPILLGAIGIGILSSQETAKQAIQAPKTNDYNTSSTSDFISKEKPESKIINRETDDDLVNSSNLLTSIKSIQSANFSDRIHFSEEEIRKLSQYIGKYTWEIINDPIFSEKMKIALGSDYEDFSINLLLSSPIEIENGSIFGSGIRPNFGGEHGSAFAINLKSGYAHIGVFDRKIGIILYEDSLQNSKPLHQWYLMHVKLMAEEAFSKKTISSLYINKNYVCGTINKETQLIFVSNYFESTKSDTQFPKTNKLIRQQCPPKTAS